MAEGNLDWLMDGLIQFLSSPIWKCNVDQFIDENCLIFDTADENKFTYTDVHNDYKTTVENLLQKFFLQELSMTLSQLLSACSDGMAVRTQFKELFQPLLAVDDFLLFKSIMVQNNLRLNKEAEESVKLSFSNPMEYHHHDEYQNGTSKTIEEKDDEYADAEEQVSSPEPEEEKLLAQVLLQSKLEYERGIEEEEREFQKLIRAATEESLKCYEMELKGSALIREQFAAVSLSPTAIDEEEERGEERGDIELDVIGERSGISTEAIISDPPNYNDLLNEENFLAPNITPTSSSIDTVPSSSDISTSNTSLNKRDHSVPLPPLAKKQVSADESAFSWLETARAEAKIDQETSTKDNQQQETVVSDLQRREEYLKRQRDNIIAKKKKERELELKHFLNDNPQYTSMNVTNKSPVLLPPTLSPPPLATNTVNGKDEESKEKKRFSLKSRKKGPVMTPAVADKVKSQKL